MITEQDIHALDVMSWIMGPPPLYALGCGGLKARPKVGTCWDHFVVYYQYPGKVGIQFSGRQFKGHGTAEGIRNRMFGSKGVLETEYGGNVLIRGENYYRGGKTTDIYESGAVANIATFHKAIVEGDFRNPTVEPSVQSNLITILGRKSAYENRLVNWTEIVESGERLDPRSPGIEGLNGRGARHEETIIGTCFIRRRSSPQPRPRRSRPPGRAEDRLQLPFGVCDWTIDKTGDPAALELAAKLGLDGVQVSLVPKGDSLALPDPDARTAYLRPPGKRRRHRLLRHRRSQRRPAQERPPGREMAFGGDRRRREMKVGVILVPVLRRGRAPERPGRGKGRGRRAQAARARRPRRPASSWPSNPT